MSENNNVISVKMANIEVPSFNQADQFNTYTDYIKYGDNNLFPNEIIKFENKSVTHKACLNLIKTSINGLGYNKEILSPDALKFLEKVDYETPNSDFLEKVSSIFSVLNGFAIEVIFDKSGLKIYSINYLPFENVRAGKTDKYGKVNTYFYSTDWTKYNNYETIQAYGTIPVDKEGYPLKKYKRTRELLYISIPNNQSLVYPNPSYDSALNWIALENELSKHHLSACVNNFLPSAMVTIFGNCTPEEQTKIGKQFSDAQTGSENSGKLIILFSESPEMKSANVDILGASNIVDIYLNTSIEAKNNIITAHSIPHILISTNESSSIFSNGTEFQNAWQNFQDTKIKYYQQRIQNAMNIILKDAGFINDKYEILPFVPTIK